MKSDLNERTNEKCLSDPEYKQLQFNRKKPG